MTQTPTAPTILIDGPSPSERRRGRPRAAEPGSAVTVWLPESEHDRLIRLANMAEVSVSELMRRLLDYRETRT